MRIDEKMDLLNALIDPSINLLPKDGIVNYYGPLISLHAANNYFQKLSDRIEWEHDEVVICGKRIVTRRKVAWYGNRSYTYTYSSATKEALPWIKELLELKQLAEESTNESFNSCLLNLYHNGDEGVAWHSDAEKELKHNGAIASLSFGAERKFSFKHKQSKETVSVILEHGSLLVMKGVTQKFWLHRLPPTKKIRRPRINLTFRTFEES